MRNPDFSKVGLFLGMAVVGVLFGIGPFAGGHDSLKGSLHKNSSFYRPSNPASTETDSYYGNVSFRGNDDGHFTRTSSTVNVKVAGGLDKGQFHIYLHNGNEYIKFNGAWIKIQGNQYQYFSYHGNQYVVTR